MNKLTADELREAYLSFFESKGHARIPGASLIPENDPTVLFTTAGMHPLVPYLMGQMPHPAGTRLTDVQKCVRTGDITSETEIAAAWGKVDLLKRIASHHALFYLSALRKMNDDRGTGP